MRVQIKTGDLAKFKCILLERLIAKMVDGGKLKSESCCDGETWYELEDIIENHLQTWR